MAYVSYAAPLAWPVPEIYRYDGHDAAKWERIAEWVHQGMGLTLMEFTGVMTNHGACLQNPARCFIGEPGADISNRPERGFNQMKRALNRVPQGDDKFGHTPPWYVRQRGRPLFSTDIRWEDP